MKQRNHFQKIKNILEEIKFKTEANPIAAKHPIAINEAGTCTYIILTESP